METIDQEKTQDKAPLSSNVFAMFATVDAF